MNFAFGGFSLSGLGPLNFLLGKNGCGKSYLLKEMEASLRADTNFGQVQYISPERAGTLVWEASVDQNMATSETWIRDVRRSNQSPNFRQQSATQYRRLELMVLREIERDQAVRGSDHRFSLVIDRINSLLDRIYLVHDDKLNFVIHEKGTGAKVDPGQISSGESELISLGIECLVFAKECDAKKKNVLLFDEPDVHLHPDLQARLGRFLGELLEQNSTIMMVLATHSTAFLGALPRSPLTRVGFKRSGDSVIAFKPVDELLQRVLPVFGAHPLSNIFNEAPALLVEGEDDERIWQQAIRSSEGRIKLYPVAVDSVDVLHDHEKEVSLIIDAVYDNAVAYSLRDGDEAAGAPIEDLSNVVRARLSCKSAENLLLTDDALKRLKTTWPEMQLRIADWISASGGHAHYPAFTAFRDSGYDRRYFDLKKIRNDLMGIAESHKSWEIIVGQAIAELVKGKGCTGANSLREFLGEKVCRALLKLP